MSNFLLSGAESVRGKFLIFYFFYFDKAAGAFHLLHTDRVEHTHTGALNLTPPLVFLRVNHQAPPCLTFSLSSRSP